MRRPDRPEDEGFDAGAGRATERSTGRFQRWMSKIWWLHSFGALAFGVGVMLFARQGLAYADKVLIVLALSWLLVFVAFRFIVGAQNRSPDDRLVKKGVRLITNYVIKQLYQQMFFFLTPLYAASATWSLTSTNWWIVPLLLLCAVLSTMDLVFDNFIMEHRVIAGVMYGFCLFAVLNLLLPLVFHFDHFTSLMIGAAATAPAVALLSFRMVAVLSARGLLITATITAGLVIGAYYGRAAIPPAPMSMIAGAFGHGAPGSYECVPGPARQMRADRLDELRCVTEIAELGGVKDDVVHVWAHDGEDILRMSPAVMHDCDGLVLKSELPQRAMPDAPQGRWYCTAQTESGQLVGRVRMEVVAPGDEEDAPAPTDPADAGKADTADAGASSDPAPAPGDAAR